MKQLLPKTTSTLIIKSKIHNILVGSSILLTGITTPMIGYSQSCDAIIQHGLRNITTSHSSDKSTSLRYFNHCQKNLDTLDINRVADAEVEIFGQGRGGAGYSEQQRRSSLQEWCTINKETAFRHQNSEQSAQSIYQGAVDAWSKCNSLLANKEVRITPNITPDSNIVDIGIVYNGNTRSGIILNGIITDGFSCEITKPDNKQVNFPEEVSNLTFNAHCKRAASRKETVDGQTYIRKASGTITVQTSAAPVQIFFPEEFDPILPLSHSQRILEALPKIEAPIGTVISSVLDEQNFYNTSNPSGTKDKWIPADGRLLPPNTLYEKITGEKRAPDLKWEKDSSVVTRTISQPIKHGENVRQAIELSDQQSSWTWLASLRDISGNRANNDYEQDVDHFQTYIDTNGSIISQGRTLNWKHGTWGSWKPGEATLFGIALRKRSNVNYYVKIN
ncbi:hypothetical protein I6G66_05910 [Delftia acidovorans]|uniref:Uncharacterized protein n=1 Tax=Delftia acidovorans TaxID=80866 RepID=A0A7T2S5W4_DELAC|nr:hypothetical protein [Delftia acidovorans]QPS09556.1 hypothetical protein I6G66_05910 [Delftia acidovorans]